MPNETEAEDIAYHDHTKEDSGLYCFKDSTRVCGADCMAFSAPPDSPDFKGQQWAKCKLLVDSHRTGKHLVILAECMNSVRLFLDDTRRVNQGPPMKVR